MSETNNEELLPPSIDEAPPTEAPPPLSTKDEEDSADDATDTEASPSSSPTAHLPIPPPLVISTFPSRLEAILNGPYTVNMRRSVQTCVLLEADRCLKNQYKRLKAFQRKVALHDTARDIVQTLEFIPQHFRDEIMWRTATSKIILSCELTWRRMKLIDREIRKTIFPRIMTLLEEGKSHDEICTTYLQLEYEKVCGKKDPYHPNWEYSHDNNFTAYRMFYLGLDVNPNLPPAVDPNPARVVPTIKPREEEELGEKRSAGSDSMASQATASPPSTIKRPRISHAASPTGGYVSMSSVGRSSRIGLTPAQVKEAEETAERRALLTEIKTHIDILNEFKGIVPDDELEERKKKLYQMLPKPTTEEEV